MAGVGEVSAIVSLAAAAAAVAKSIVEISARVKDAKDQYLAFAKELKILSQVLNQLEKFLSSTPGLDPEAYLLTEDIIESCSVLLNQLENFRDKLLGPETTAIDERFSFSVLKRTKWALGSTELSMQRDRVDSMKTNILMMMTMMMLQLQTAKNIEEPVSRTLAMATFEELTQKNKSCLTRLDQLETSVSSDATLVEETVDSQSILTTRTVDSIRSTTESILSIYAKLNVDNSSTHLEVHESAPQLYTNRDKEEQAAELIQTFLERPDVKHVSATDKCPATMRSISAGRNLTTFSLIVQNFQLFDEHVELVQDLWRIRERCEEFLQLLLVANVEYCSFQRSLLEQSTNAELVERLMNDYNDPYWFSPELDQNIRDVLQDKFTVYQSIQTQMNLFLEPILAELTRNGLGQLRHHLVRDVIERDLLRIWKDVVRKHIAHDRLLTQLSKCNHQLCLLATNPGAAKLVNVFSFRTPYRLHTSSQ